MDSPEKKKKLVISSEDLSDIDGSPARAAAAKTEPSTAETKAHSTKKVTTGPGKGSSKNTPPAPKTQRLRTRPTGATAGPGQEPWYRRHTGKLIFGTGLLAALAVGFVISFVLLGIFDSADERTREALTDAATTLESSTADVSAAAHAALPFAALDEVAAASDARASAVDSATRDLTDKVDDERLVDPALKALNAEQRFLVRLSTIADFPEGRLRKRWRRLKPKLTRSREQIDATREQILALNLGNEANLMPANADISAAIDAAGSIIIAADRKLRIWRAELAAARTQLAEAESYRASMASLIDEYYEQRDETRALVNEPRVRYDVAAETLEAHAVARQGIIDRMNSLAIPAGVEAAHSEMVNLAIESQQLLTAAAEETLIDPFTIWTGSPGYLRFSTESDGITARFDPAKSAVLGAADSMIASLKAEAARVGPKPRI